jgi:hypothetical protein
MRLLSRIKRAGRNDLYREKVLELATEFMLEASVLSGVLGILESAISWHNWPTGRVIGMSLSFAVGFFLLGCILQALKDWDRDSLVDHEASNSLEEGV